MSDLESIEAILVPHFARLAAGAPGHCSLKIELSSGLRYIGHETKVSAYNAHISHKYAPQPALAVDLVLAEIKGRTEAELLRAEAAALLEQAEKLEAKEDA